MAFNQDPPKLKAPAGTCDTHMHIYDGRYPSAPTAPFTPPDALSMLSLAFPLVALYEVSVICVMMIERGKAREEAARKGKALVP